MSKIEEIRDKFGDALRLSKFAQDRSLVKRFAGGSITREDYETYSKNGRVDEIFGHIVNANPHKMYFGFGPSFGYAEAEKLRNYMLATDVLSFMMEADVSLDLDDPKNARTKEILEQGINVYALKYNHAPPLLKPYCEHPDLKPLLERHRFEGNKTIDGPVYNPHTASKDQLDEMRDHGIGF